MKYYRVYVVASLILAVGVSLVLPAPASAKKGDKIEDAFGANIHLRQRIPEFEWDEVMTAASDAGVQWGREQFNWDVIEPSDVKPDNDAEFQWDAYDAVIDAYEDAGIEPLGLLTYSSSWASDNSAATNYEFYPPDTLAWGNYVKNVASHYAGRVDYWEIWNEPNHSGFWQGTDEEYIELLAKAIEKIKEGNPDAKIVLGGMSGTDYDFVDMIFNELEDPSAIDVVAVHPYRVAGSNYNYGPEDTAPGLDTLVSDLTSLRAVMKRHNLDDTPVWLTEIGWTTYEDGVTDKKQARMLMRLFSTAFSVPGVQKIFWYSFTDTADNPAYLEGHFGLVDSEYNPKQALAAFTFVQEQLTGKRFVDHSLSKEKTLDRFNTSNGWRFAGTKCTEGTVHDTTNGTMKISYRFTEDTNCYAPIALQQELTDKAKVIQFRAKGENDDTKLRIRISDAQGETFQYNLGYVPKEWLYYSVQLKGRADYWGGDGVIDYPIQFDSFVLDDNDGSRAEGVLYIDDITYSKVAKTHLYRYKKGRYDTYAYWSTRKKSRTLKLNMPGVGKIQVNRLNKASAEKFSGNSQFTVRANKSIKFLQTQ